MNAATADAPGPPRRFVAVAVGEYEAMPALPSAVADAQTLARVLEERHGYGAQVLANPTRDDVEDCLAPGSLAKADLIVYWIGHGRVGADGTLQLLATKANRVLASAADLGRWVAETGAHQVLLLLDACHSGSGLLEALRQAFETISGRSRIGAHWFGVLAASRAEEDARAGALVQAFRELLEQGPREPDIRWARSQPNLRGDDMLTTLAAEWAHGPHAEQQSVMQMNFGAAQRPMLRNPLFEIGLGTQPVEHLLQAARGGSEVESFFTGRQAALTALVAWLAQRQPGLMVVTGPAGCGKSALLGRLASLSVPEERARLLRAGPVPAELDPGAGSVHAQLQLRGTSAESAAERLARQLGADPAQGLYGVLALAHERLECGAPLVVLLDGLDEAGEQAGLVAQELVAVLARQALVLVASRRLEFGDTGLTALAGVKAEVVDLAQDPATTLEDVRQYVMRRLAGISPLMDAALVAEALSSGRGADATAPFLLARLVTSQLRESPLDTSVADWRLSLVSSAQNALEQDMRRVVLTRDGQMLPDAARELMAALAWAHGAGFPADDIWPEIATRLSRQGTRYTRDDAYTLLAEMGRHIVASVEDGQQVYRIAHQVLVDYLQTTAGDGKALAVAQAVHDTWAGWIDAGHPPQAHGYLWSFAWLHMADAGAEGLALLEALAARDRPVFLLDMALAYGRAAEYAWEAGHLDAALAWREQSVNCRRDLGDPRRLTLSLFQLSLARSEAGDDDGAERAAAEATELARGLRSDRQARDIVEGAWFARAMAQVRLGHLDSARRWARELLGFVSEQDEPDDPFSLCRAHLLLSTVAGLQGDIPAAREHGQQAVQVFDAVSGPEPDPTMLREVLAGAVFAESMAAQLALQGRLAQDAPPPDLTAGLRLLAEHRRVGALRSSADIATAKGFISLVRIIAMGQAETKPAQDLPDIEELLQETVVLASGEAVRANAYAVLARGAALTILAQLEFDSRPDQARNHLEQAAAALREGAEGSGLVAFQLGECLDLVTQLDLRAEPDGLPRDVAASLARQNEAVARLRTVQSPMVAGQFVAALGRLSWLRQLNGDNEAAAAAREEAIQRLRDRASLAPGERLLLAGLLADQAGCLVDNRAGEALTMAEECVALADQSGNGPQERLIKAIALVNAAAARFALDRLASSRFELTEVERLTADLLDNPAVVAARASACLNLASLELQEGDAAKAVGHARQAVELFATPGLPEAFTTNAPLAEVTLGQAECASGDTASGSRRLGQAVDHVRALVALQVPEAEALVTKLVLGMDRVAPAMWPEVEAVLQVRPPLLARVRWMRRRPAEQWPDLVRELDQALQSTGPLSQRELRQIVRAHRAIDPERFEAAWRQAVGDVPAWMRNDAEIEWVVIGWWNTPTWPLSRDYLLAHPELLAPATDAILEEFALEPSTAELAQDHLRLLARAREQGAQAAYAPMMLGFEVRSWLRSDDPQGYLAQHPELQRVEVGQWLREHAGPDDRDAAAFLSVWQLLQRGEDALAFRALADPAVSAELLPAAWRSADASRLTALARLLWARAEGSLRRRSVLAWAVAEALEPSDAAPPALAEELAGLSAADRAELTTMVTDAMAHHPDAAAALAPLVTAVHVAEGAADSS